MKKLDNQGFMLTETLVVATFVIATLVFLYAQFRTINRSYTTSFKYNNAEELYALGNVSDYLKLNGLSVVGPAASLADDKYLDITSCPGRFLSETNYCTALIESLNIKKIIITSENLNEIKANIKNDNILSEEMKNFINSVNYDANGSNYFLIAEFKNGTFAVLKVM